jgi:hypothetical protein
MAAVAISVIAVVAYTVRPRETATPPEKLDRIDPASKTETKEGTVVQWKGDKQNIRIEFEGQTTNNEGENKLLGVKILVDNREGRGYVVTGKEAFIGSGTPPMTCAVTSSSRPATA